MRDWRHHEMGFLKLHPVRLPLSEILHCITLNSANIFSKDIVNCLDNNKLRFLEFDRTTSDTGTRLYRSLMFPLFLGR